MTRLVVDSTCDLPTDQMDALGIVMVPLQVHFGDESFKDKIEMDTDAFFDRLDTVTKLPTTSQPSPGQFIEAYEAIPESEPIISIHIAEQLSGTVQSARLAAKQLTGRDIRVIDSGSVTWGAGLLTMVAADAIKEGLDADAVEAAVMEAKPRVRMVAILDTLKYAIMGGRVSKVQGAIGSMLRVKPLMAIQDGVITRLAPARTWGQGYQKAVDDIKEHGGPERLAVIHARAPEAMKDLKQILEKEFGGEIQEGTIGAVVGTYAGPGAAAVAYIGKKAG
ncbi:MAG: fatty acid kinase fatty acid binding subunit [Chloroflexota bacterium]|jgi:DegV family protein with EDD domain|nr:fatty acid kinase fatty acid binding subunit [Chloroflexota bacterium]